MVPPLAHLDADRYGCYALLSALWRVRPKLHVFGHIHAGRGVEPIEWDRAQMAYENICAGRTGWGGLVKLLWYMAVEVVLSGGWCLYCLGQHRSGGGPEGWPEDCYGNLRITVMMHPLSIWPDHGFTIQWVSFQMFTICL
jgi:hypothetical protein